MSFQRSSWPCTHTWQRSLSAQWPSTTPSAGWAPYCRSCTLWNTTTGLWTRRTAAESCPKALVRMHKHTACVMSFRTGAGLCFSTLCLFRFTWWKQFSSPAEGSGRRLSSRFMSVMFFRWSEAKPEGDPFLARLPVVVCETAHHEGTVTASKAERKKNTGEKA